MSPTMKVKLARKVVLKDPSGVPMEMGRVYSVTRNQFWLKREQAGDVVEVSAKSAKISDKAKPGKSKGRK